MSLTVSAEVKTHQETCTRMETEHKDQQERLCAMQAVSELSFLSADLAEQSSMSLRSGWWVHQNLSKMQRQQMLVGVACYLFSFISLYNL